MPLDQMDEHVVYPLTGILVGSEKEQMDTHNNMDKPEKHHVEWKQPHTKGYIRYDSIQEKANL